MKKQTSRLTNKERERQGEREREGGGVKRRSKLFVMFLIIT